MSFIDPDEFKDPDSFIDPDAGQEAAAFSKESFKVPLANALNTVDIGWTALAGAVPSLLGNYEEADKVYKGQAEREAKLNKWANPENKQLSFAGEVAGTIATLPAQVLAMPMSPFRTAKTLIDKGEDVATAQQGALVDTAGNMLGAVSGPGMGRLGRIAFGGGVNAAQEAAVSTIVSSLAKTEAGKKEFEPTIRKTALAGIVGGGVGLAIGKRKQAKPTIDDSALKTRVAERQAEKAFLDEKIKEVNEQQVKLLDDELMRSEEAKINSEEAIREQQALSDPANQKQLPFENTVEDVAAVRAAQDPTGQVDMFVDQAREQTPANQALIQTQERLQTLLEKRKVLEEDLTKAAKWEDIDKAYRQKEFLESSVEKLQQKFHAPQSQRGAVDMSIFEPNFFKIKKIGDFVMSVEGTDTGVKVDVRDGNGANVAVGNFMTDTFIPAKDSNLMAAYIETRPRYQKQGIAREIYKFLSELQNDIVPSKTQLPDGEAMWKSFEREGLSKNMKIPRSQRGGIDLKAVEEGLAKLSKKNELRDPKGVDRSFLNPSEIPADPIAKGAADLALSKGFKSNPNLAFSADAITESGKTGSYLLKAVGQIVQNYGKRSEKWVKEVVHPLERQLRTFKAGELIDLEKLLKAEFDIGGRFTAKDLADLGVSEKMASAYSAFRQSMDAALAVQNEGRVALGKKPITAVEAYYAARWKGAFGANIVDKEGNVVWKLTDETRLGLGKQVQALLKKFPELSHKNTKTKDGVPVTKDFDRLNLRGIDESNVETAYSMMVDVLGRDNELVQAIKKFKEETDISEGRKVGGQEKHFKRKSGMRGFEGDKGDFISPEADAREFFKQQMQYLKNASRWAEIQKAMPNLKELLNDERLVAQQPQHVKWARNYVENSLGFGELKFIRAAENYLGKAAGISPGKVMEWVGNIKLFWVLQKLGTSAGYTAASGIQLSNTLPHHVNLSVQGFHANPISTAAAGFFGGLGLTAFHYQSVLSNKGMADMTKGYYGPEYMKKAFEYAEKNSVTNRSVYDETPIGDKNFPGKRTFNATVTAPETIFRSIAYMSFVQHLQESGRFGKDNWNAMFQKAEELTNSSMGDARNTERAPVFTKTGIVGSGFNTLQTFSVNYFNQASMFVREANRGNPLPLFTMIATQAFMAGAIGMPFVEDLAKTWDFIKNNMLSDAAYNEAKDLDVRTFLIETFGETGAYGVPSVWSGYNMTSRLNAPSFLNAATVSGNMVTDVANQLRLLGDAATSITDDTKWAQSILESTPPGMKELMSQIVLEEQTQKTLPNGNIGVFNKKKLSTPTQQYERTPAEHEKARMGIRLQKEVMQSDLAYPIHSMESEMRQRSGSVLDKIYLEIKKNGTLKKDGELVRLYIDLGGTDQGIASGLTERATRENLSAFKRDSISAGSSAQAALNYQRVQKALKEAGYVN